MRLRTTTTIALALVVAGCGGDEEQSGEPIPAESAAALERQLDSIQARFDAGGGACADITGNADPNTTAVENAIASLPEDVDPEVRDSLEQSFDRLFELVDQQCEAEAETDTEPAPPLETDTEPVETLPPEEEDDDDDDEEEAPPPEETTPPEEVPPEEVPPTDGGLPGQGDGGGAVVPGEGE